MGRTEKELAGPCRVENFDKINKHTFPFIRYFRVVITTKNIALFVSIFFLFKRGILILNLCCSQWGILIFFTIANQVSNCSIKVNSFSIYFEQCKKLLQIDTILKLIIVKSF